MKIAGKKLKGATASGPTTMPVAMRDQLNGLTIQEGIDQGLIKDLGDDQGRFIFPHKEFKDRHYAIVNGHTVPVSAGLGEMDDDAIQDVLGNLRFNKGVSTINGDGFGKEFFRLGRPAEVNLDLDNARVSINEQVETV